MPSAGSPRYVAFCALALAVLCMSVSELRAGGFLPAASMASVRANHAAALLPSSRVLVCGGKVGDASGAATAASEIYDPLTDQWSAAAPLSAARIGHSATMLPNGKVLVAGGAVASGSASSAELYDPLTDSWSSAGELITARYGHTTTLLPSGKVLVAGGSDVNGYSTDTAEIYDPGTNTWSAVSNLGTPRRLHAAALLPSGKVLVAGGFSGQYMGYLKGVEIFDPATNIWAASPIVPDMDLARTNFALTTLASGSVMASGGQSPVTTNSAEVYRENTNSWMYTPSMPRERYGHTATLLADGHVLMTGGHYPWGAIPVYTSALNFDEATATWTVDGRMNSPRVANSVTLLPSGKVLFAGGLTDDNGTFLSSTELYDPDILLRDTFDWDDANP
mgnify:CR=1 FL=1